MTFLSGAQPLRRLQQNRGGFHYLEVDAATVASLPEKQKTRVICTIDNKLSLRCGINALGDGNFYLLIAKRYIDVLEKQVGALVEYQLTIDPDPLGVDLPEVMHELLAQDQEAKKTFEKLAYSRQRTLIHQITRIKNIDIQVRRILDFLDQEAHNIQQRKTR